MAAFGCWGAVGLWPRMLTSVKPRAQLCLLTSAGAFLRPHVTHLICGLLLPSPSGTPGFLSCAPRAWQTLEVSLNSISLFLLIVGVSSEEDWPGCKLRPPGVTTVRPPAVTPVSVWCLGLGLRGGTASPYQRKCPTTSWASSLGQLMPSFERALRGTRACVPLGPLHAPFPGGVPLGRAQEGHFRLPTLWRVGRCRFGCCVRVWLEFGCRETSLSGGPFLERVTRPRGWQWAGWPVRGA